MKLTALILAAASAAAFGQATGSAPDAQPDSQKLLCVFLDLNAMSPAQQAKAQAVALQYIQDKAAPTDLVEIAAYTSKFSVIQDFTADRSSLLAAIQGLKPTRTDNDSTGRAQALQAATASLTNASSQGSLVYVTTPAGSSNYMAALNAIRFNANASAEPVGVALLPIQP